MMRVLVLHRSCSEKRKTIDDHLYSFKRYVKDVEFFYCDVYFKVPSFMRWIDWDGVIIHYTLLGERFDQRLWKNIFKGLAKTLPKTKGFKIAIPQDEFILSDQLCELFRLGNVETVFTCASSIDYETIYPLEKSGLKHRISTLTGFVDEETIEILESLSKEVQERTIDIGYRARNLPYWVGAHGQYKGVIADRVLQAPNPFGLKLDISTKYSDVFYGNDWLKFLLRCNTTLGCLGGSSLHDPDGTIRKKVDEHVRNNPQATFQEVEKACFPGLDYKLHLFALSPRHFECAMSKTCQILLEGDYQGVLSPGIHYIELKKDFSNLAEVMKLAADREYCNEIAENAYCDIVASKKYTYSAFANQVIDHIRQFSKPQKVKSETNISVVRYLLGLHNRWRIVYTRFLMLRNRSEALLRRMAKKTLVKLGLMKR